VSFAVRRGEILGLIGPNGSGKTTLFNLIAGALRPETGRVYMGDLDITGRPASDRTALGLARTFQLVHVLSNFTTLENVLVARLYGRAGRESMGDALADSLRLLERLALADKKDTPAHALTVAEGKRLEIARALAANPSVLLLDEPLGGLSTGEVASALELFRTIRAEGMTLVIVEHNVHAVRAICDRVVMLNSGRKVAEGTPSEVLSDPEVVAVYLGRRH
jgi:ABC-type branched-subunit amino acid transport system ATPase component